MRRSKLPRYRREGEALPPGMRIGSMAGLAGRAVPAGIRSLMIGPLGKLLSQPKKQSGLYGTTAKDTLLESVPPGVTTLTFPVVAPAGTVVVISALDATLKTAVLPLKVTLVAPVRLVPRILTAAPTAPESVWVSTNGPKPTVTLKIVPQPSLQLLDAPMLVVP